MNRAVSLAAATVLLFALGAAANPASASAAGTATLTISPPSGPPGTSVEVAGDGFPNNYCGTEATLYWTGHREHVQVPLRPGNGGQSFTTDLTVPEDTSPKIELRSQCGSGDVLWPGPSAFFFFVARPGTTSAPSSSRPPSATVTTTTTAAPSTPAATTTGTTTTRTSDRPPTGRTGSITTTTATTDAIGDGGGPRDEVPVRPVRMTDTLASVYLARPSVAVLLFAAVLAALLILLVAFPAELFNKTYEHNQHEIHWLLGKIGLRRQHLPSALGVVLFVAAGAGLSAMLAGSEGADGNPVAQVLGFAVAIPVVAFAYGLPTEAFSRTRSGIAAPLRVVPVALFVAVLCAALSLLLDLDPPYLYGLFAGFAVLPARKLGTAGEGFGVLLGVLFLATTGVLAWLLWHPVHGVAYGPQPTWLAVIADAALFWIFVLAAESLVFALPPLRFLDGRRLRDWHPLIWLAPQAGALGLFVYVFILRARLDPPDGGASAVVKALLFFLIFGAFSLAFWGYFKWAGRPTAGRWARSPRHS